MRLVSIELQNFRRFQGLHRLNVDGKVIALIGPNEAGKSSVLEALAAFGSQERFRPDQITREVQLQDSDVVVRLRFLLESQDLAQLSHLSDERKPRWYVRWKRVDGRILGDFDPPIRRDIQKRAVAARELDALQRTRWLRERLSSGSPEISEEALRAQLKQAIAALSSSAETLNQRSISLLGRLDATLRELVRDAAPGRVRMAIATLRRQLAVEREEHPKSVARRLLNDSRPQMSLFDAESRDLRSSYQVAEIADDPPIALANLAALARLDLGELARVAAGEDAAEQEGLVAGANDRLREFFADVWSRGNVTVRFSLNAGTLHVLVPRVGGGFSTIAERSDGLRSFVALVGHAANKTKRPPILLIDEAERHLHYDAQADLVRMMTRQETAQQVLYTTHSAGCLPEDLGAAVRVAVQVEGSHSSELRNTIWETRPGFDPLFFAMGASAFAFSAARRAVFAEGISDVILLPALLKSATGVDELGFQVAPGLAQVNHRSAKELDLEGGRIAYVVDGDEAGTAISRQLVKSGVRADRIIQIGPAGSVIEDFVHIELYAAAVREETRRSGDELDLEADTIPQDNRPRFVEEACREAGIGAPPKRKVAEHVLELRTGFPSLHDPDRTEALSSLLADLRERLS